MTPEKRDIPTWAQRERQADLDWINENLEVFCTAAKLAHGDEGRGAIVVDTTSQPIPGAGNPFAYFPQQLVKQHTDQDTQRMVADYDPAWELVLVLLKSDNRTSTYRVGVPSLRPQAPEASDVSQSGRRDARPGSRLKAPNIETLARWEADGGCEAACPHHCWTDPDGTCEHGHPSWLLKLGMI
jgi:hypothetical protein